MPLLLFRGPVSARVRVRWATGFGDRQLAGVNGEFFAAGFDPGAAQVRIAAAGFLPASLHLQPGGSVDDLGTIFLSRGAAVSATLVDTRTGKPLVGAAIEMVPPGDRGTQAARYFGDSLTATSDRDGRFTLSGLTGGTPCAVIRHPSVGEVPIIIEALEPNEIRYAGVLALGNNPNVTGRVRDSDGLPVNDASVELRFGPMYSPCLTRAATLHQDGTFAFQAVAPGPYRLLALRGHQVIGSRPFTVNAGTDTREDIELQTVAVHGAISVDGLPVSGGAVSLKRGGADEFRPPTLLITYVGPGLDQRQQPVTDIVDQAFFTVAGDGSFEGKAHLDPGEYEVMWTAPAGSSWYHSRTTLAPDASALTLTMQFAGVHVSGRVTAKDGLPVPRAIVTLNGAARSVERTVFTGPDGSFVIPQTAPGRWTIAAHSAKGDARTAITVEAKDVEGIALSVAENSQSSVRVTVESNPDLPAIASVFLTNGVDFFRMKRSEATTEFESVAPGAYKLFAIDDRGGIVSGPTVTAGPGGATVRLAPQATRRVRLRFPKSEPGQRVVLSCDGYPVSAVLGSQGQVPTILDDGTASLPPLSAGKWTVRFGGRVGEIDATEDGIQDLD